MIRSKPVQAGHERRVTVMGLLQGELLVSLQASWNVSRTDEFMYMLYNFEHFIVEYEAA